MPRDPKDPNKATIRVWKSLPSKPGRGGGLEEFKDLL
jgi:hypothetical protein